ncbi:MAG: HD domain-containing protein [Anaerolineaceae bacterium]
MPKSTQTMHFSANQRERSIEVLKLAKTCQYDEMHTQQVVQLALQIFDQLQELLDLGEKEKFYLWCAACLHDIGIQTEGTKGHHKTVLRIILSTPILQFSSKERLVIGSIARYHRKTLPNCNHSHFAALEDQEKKMVSRLAAILRVATGLDDGHTNNVEQVKISIHKQKIVFKCKFKQKGIVKEIRSATRKSDLLEECTSRKIIFVKDE